MARTYRDIKADILGRITRGDWKPGSLLPGEIELAETYGVARATVNRAMRELTEDGIIERKRKSGTRVRLSPLRQARFDIPIVRHEVTEQGAAYRYALVSSTVGPAPDWLRARMGLQTGDEVRHLTCLHMADGQPYQYEDRWISLALLPQARVEDFAATAPTEWLIAQIPYSEVDISLSATAADEGLAAHLACRPGEPLLQIERSTRWDGKAVTFVQLVHRPGHRMTTRY
ncbi:UTRA domain-containing protein [Aliigemmobacter aestuarii]|uniref:UTRA domain-containing protein n=1 Tax=Aliigemmobacter aestuarii TaxID=1445661 RepID=A0A4S3MJH7_9RHOB|nr:GntR family transcriptional regulator [Gemmobacter aestuarii]THD81356.1 UTRA domain-containing protein [Gemmobacter aestuarii]